MASYPNTRKAVQRLKRSEVNAMVMRQLAYVSRQMGFTNASDDDLCHLLRIIARPQTLRAESVEGEGAPDV